MTAGKITPTEYREGVESQLREELTHRCIKYPSSGGKLEFKIELTDEAHMLIGMLAAASDLEERNQ